MPRNARGALPDYYAEPGNLTGLSFSYVAYDMWAQAEEPVAGGETDVLGLTNDDESGASVKGLMLTGDYMTQTNEGKYEIDESLFNVHEMMHSLDVVYAPLAKESGLEWGLSVDDGAEGDLIGDELRLKQVLVNLISNAIKYNKPGGSVRVFLKALDSTPAGQGLRFFVADIGIGISQEDIAIVFQPFQRVGAPRCERFLARGWVCRSACMSSS